MTKTDDDEITLMPSAPNYRR